MREIKFRAWDKHVGVFYEWNPIMMTDWLLDKDCVLNQYTGIKDKNGKEIYEGDLLSAGEEYSTQIVSFLGGSFRVNTAPDNDDWILLSEFISPSFISPEEKITIIGNIYENPELLEKHND